jgi:hypothetical protein
MRPSSRMATAVGIALALAACTRAPSDRRAVTPGERPPAETVLESPGPRISVPDVTQLTTTQADRILTRVGLMIRVNTVGGDDALVVSQTPLPGTIVDPGSRVRVRARCYPAPCPSPPKGEHIYDPCTCASR